MTDYLTANSAVFAVSLVFIGMGLNRVYSTGIALLTVGTLLLLSVSAAYGEQYD